MFNPFSLHTYELTERGKKCVHVKKNTFFFTCTHTNKQKISCLTNIPKITVTELLKK